MRFTTTSALLLGAASTAVGLQDQKILGGASGFGFDLDAESWIKPLEEKFGEFTSEAKATWDEVAMLAPGAFDAFKKHVIGAKTKPNNRKSDSKWDHVVKGADLQSIRITDENGDSRRKIGGKLEPYNLRVKKVDPAKLGVDSVKQYSGYLDDEENDKHLFYCELQLIPPSWR